MWVDSLEWVGESGEFDVDVKGKTMIGMMTRTTRAAFICDEEGE